MYQSMNVTLWYFFLVLHFVDILVFIVDEYLVVPRTSLAML